MSGVALVHHSFGPYHLSRAQKLKALLSEPLHLLELATSEQLREWKRPDSADVRSAVSVPLEGARGAEVVAGIGRLLTEAQPDVVVIAGYAHAGMRAAARWARANEKKAVLLSDSHRADKPRFRVKEVAKSVWIRSHFQAAFTSGAMGAEYVRSLGVDPHAIWRGYDVVDNELFARAASLARANAEQTRRALSLPERFFLYVGRFAEEKNLPMLLEAFAAYRQTAGANAASLVLVGSGPEETALRKLVQKHALEGAVLLAGFLQQEDLARVYGLALALVLPSTVEPWGLVVNEAMAAELPVIVSTRCGCVLDLVFPGVNGFLIDPSSSEGCTRALAALGSDPDRARRMGAQSARIIAPWSLERWAGALADCVTSVRGRV